MQTSEEKGNLVTIDWRPPEDVLKNLALPPVYEANINDVATFQRGWRRTATRVRLQIGLIGCGAGLQRNMDYPNDYAFPCDSVAPGGKGRFFDSYCNWHRIPEYTKFVGSSAAASMACQFMRSTSAQFFS